MEAVCLGFMCSFASGNIILKAGLPSLVLTWRNPAHVHALRKASLLPADWECHLRSHARPPSWSVREC